MYSLLYITTTLSAIIVGGWIMRVSLWHSMWYRTQEVIHQILVQYLRVKHNAENIFPVLSLHSIPAGGGSAPTRCLPTTNKTQNKKKEGVLPLRLDRKIHSLSPCWNDSTNTWSRDNTDSKQVIGQIILHKPEWSFPGSLPSLQSPCYTRHGRETGQWGNNIFNVQW